MAKRSHQRIGQGQNFLRSPGLVRAMVQASSISAMDIVYEIGPGHGIITSELAQTSKRVIAIEKDPILVRELHHRFQDVHNVKIIEGDFLSCRIPEREYKIFANIPFNITADILRRILYVPPTPSEAYLVTQKEAAEKFAGNPRETQFSILAKPWYKLEIIRELRRTDFDPVPGVNSVLFHIRKRCPAGIRDEDGPLYRSFVRYGFGRWRKNLKSIFKLIFTYNQWKHLSNDLHFRSEATPSELTVEQWLGLFECFKCRVAVSRQARLMR